MRKLLSTFRVTPFKKLVSSEAPLWRPNVKVWHRLFVPCLRMVRVTEGKLTRGRVKLVAYFAKECSRIALKQGEKGLCLYLKTCAVMLQQAAPGSRLSSSSREINKVAVKATSTGIPRIIPRNQRDALRRGDARLFSLWLTLFGLYRVLSYKGKLSLSSITRPGRVIPKPVMGNLVKFIPDFIRKLEQLVDSPILERDPAKVLKPHPLAMSTSSANAGPKETSFGSRGHAAWMWYNDHWGSALWQYLWCLEETDTTQSFWHLIRDEAVYSATGRKWNGRLSTKEEAAGKVRVFALVDYWTQCALRPLHDYILEILKEIPQDGTFDQYAPVERLLKRIPMDQVVYSFDLKSATDRLSVTVQEKLLANMFTEGLAWSWRKLLVDRNYRIPRGSEGLFGEKAVRYSVGQPMGAYSSWAMLALTHHMLIQWAASLVGIKGWFADYAVLGDDVIIANDKVANRYRTICRWIGLEIGLAKSLISSQKCSEFAKRYTIRGEIVRVTPWKLFGAASGNLNSLLTMMQWLKSTPGPKLNLPNALLAFGVGMKGANRVGHAKWGSLSRRLQVLVVLITHPSANTWFSASNWIEWLTSDGPSFKRKMSDETLVGFTKWAQDMENIYIQPMEDRLTEIKSALLFYPKVGTRVDQYIRGEVARKVEAFEDAWTKSAATVRHLAKLNINLQARQASAVFTQVVRLLENRLAEIPLVPESLMNWREETPVRLTQVHSLWARWRARAEGSTEELSTVWVNPIPQVAAKKTPVKGIIKARRLSKVGDLTRGEAY